MTTTARKTDSAAAVIAASHRQAKPCYRKVAKLKGVTFKYPAASMIRTVWLSTFKLMLGICNLCTNLHSKRSEGWLTAC